MNEIGTILVNGLDGIESTWLSNFSFQNHNPIKIFRSIKNLMSVRLVAPLVREVTRPSNRMYSASDGVQVEYRYIHSSHAPKNRATTFISGVGSPSQAIWFKQYALRRKLNILLTNNRGAGATALTDSGVLHRSALDVYELCGHLGITEIDVVGHSMGGMIATLLYHQYGGDGVRIRSMTFVATPDVDPIESFPLSSQIPVHLVADLVIDSLEGGKLDLGAGLIRGNRTIERIVHSLTRKLGVKYSAAAFRHLVDNVLKNPRAVGVALREMREHGLAIGGMMSKIAVPTLVVYGHHDFLVSQVAAHRIKAKIAGASIMAFDDSTHAPQFEEPKRFNEILAEHIESTFPRLRSV
ncbi:alpha/beta fold hydrolase [Candidatus Micrarchaeota archaeon]|nr:alpha/beta fold hydrolase [Candidatus Micrarchaeota archaeon]